MVKAIVPRSSKQKRVPTLIFLAYLLAASAVTSRTLLHRSLAFFSPSARCLGTYRWSIMKTGAATTMDTEEREGLQEPIWDPQQQIYIGGVPENAEVTKLLQDSHGALRIFGYGSLCWNPGHGVLSDDSVRHTLGRALGYRRCWAQKSTDHRGNPNFPGIVCTLLKDEEFRLYRPAAGSTTDTEEPSLTEGLLYEVPRELADECLTELDFREKGGYARDVIEVVEDESGNVVPALLYRGTPSNPAIWPRALKDLPFAAAVMSVAVGPSGENIEYLDQLDTFLEHTADPQALKKFDDTFALASMARTLRDKFQLFFLFGAGSNQHNQLLLERDPNDSDQLGESGESHELTEIVACVREVESDVINGAGTVGSDFACQLFAGGGHSGILTRSGRLYLFGWNEANQLGTSGIVKGEDLAAAPMSPLPVVSELRDLRVSTASLGFSHTLVIERVTNKLWVFGDNTKGQANGVVGDPCVTPTTPPWAAKETFVSVAAGVFHSAAVTTEGALVTFGCQRSGALSPVRSDPIGRWNPCDGSKILGAACGRKHSIAFDDQGRVWTWGDNGHGQLGRDVREGKRDSNPQLVELPCLCQVVHVSCGWSHNVVLAKCSNGSTIVFGWGRNDKGELGTGHSGDVPIPVLLFTSHNVQSVACGSESTVFLDADDELWCCGWNEHGNLATGDAVDRFTPCKAVGARVNRAPGYPDHATTCFAAGGSHILAMKVFSPV